MDELLQKLLESDVLTEETRTELAEAFTKHIGDAKATAITEATEELTATLRVELQTQYQDDKAALIEALDSKAQDFMTSEIEELKESIDSFRDLEVEYAERLAEAKSEYANVVRDDMAELVDILDGYLDNVVAEEVAELKEDIQEVRKLKFGASMFESIEATYAKKFFDADGAQEKLDENISKLEAAEANLTETEAKLAVALREAKMVSVLEPLMGKSRDVMGAILKNVPTEKLDEAYNSYIGKVLTDVVATSDTSIDESEKESDKRVLAEGEETIAATDEESKSVIEGSVLLDGNAEDKTIVENSDIDNQSDNKLSEEDKNRIRQLML